MIQYAICDFLLVICNNVYNLHCFWDSGTFTVYVMVTFCDLENSFSFDTTLEIADHIRFQIYKNIVVNTCNISGFSLFFVDVRCIFS